MCIFSEAVGTVWKTYEFYGFVLAFEGDEKLFALFDGAAVIDFAVHEQDGCLYFGCIGERGVFE